MYDDHSVAIMAQAVSERIVKLDTCFLHGSGAPISLIGSAQNCVLVGRVESFFDIALVCAWPSCVRWP